MVAFRMAAAALLAWCIGKALGVPIWRDGWDIGDRADLAILAAYLVWLYQPKEPRP